MKAIVCIGNRYDSRDAAGPAVHDYLAARGAPPGIELIDGGLAGLGLLCRIDGAERVVFVDSVSGFGEPGEVVVVDPEEIRAGPAPSFDHAAGLDCLLRVAPLVCERGLPEMIVVGVEAGAHEGAIRAAAERAVAAARGGVAARAAEVVRA